MLLNFKSWSKSLRSRTRTRRAASRSNHVGRMESLEPRELLSAVSVLPTEIGLTQPTMIAMGDAGTPPVVLAETDDLQSLRLLAADQTNVTNTLATPDTSGASVFLNDSPVANRPPVGVDDEYTVVAGGTLVVPLRFRRPKYAFFNSL